MTAAAMKAAEMYYDGQTRNKKPAMHSEDAFRREKSFSKKTKKTRTSKWKRRGRDVVETNPNLTNSLTFVGMIRFPHRIKMLSKRWNLPQM